LTYVWSAHLPVIKIAQLRAGVSIGAERANADLPPEYVIDDGDVLFSWSGSLMVERRAHERACVDERHLFGGVAVLPNYLLAMNYEAYRCQHIVVVGSVT
jgi:hypothetical protein